MSETSTLQDSFQYYSQWLRYGFNFSVHQQMDKDDVITHTHTNTHTHTCICIFVCAYTIYVHVYMNTIQPLKRIKSVT